MKGRRTKKDWSALVGKLFAFVIAAVLIFLFWNFTLNQRWMRTIAAFSALFIVYVLYTRQNSVCLPSAQTQSDGKTSLQLFLASFIIRFFWCTLIL